MKLIPLQDNKGFCKVDDADFDFLNKWKWYLDNSGYACAHENKKRFLMHRVLLNAKRHQETAHLNNNKLDNRRRNIKILDRSTVKHNRKKYSNNSSGFRGVHWDKNAQKWFVQIRRDKQVFYLGLYENLLEAAQVYDEKAKELYGDFAKLNFPHLTQRAPDLGQAGDFSSNYLGVAPSGSRKPLGF